MCGQELACCIDMGLLLITIARAAYKTHFPTALCKVSAIWVNLKATNNSSIQTLGVIQVDVEV